jgi:hypothetical protein
MLLQVLALASMVGAPDGVQPSAGPVRTLGGKSRSANIVFLLDLRDEARGPARVLKFNLRQPNTVTIVELEKTSKALEPFGLARPNDGSFWILADKGRAVARFDENTGRLLRFDALSQASEGVWTFGSRVVFGLVQLKGGEPLLAMAVNDGIRPFTNLKSRAGGSPPETLTKNIVECGFAETSHLPCWWVSGVPEVMRIHENGEVTFSSAPTLIDAKLFARSGQAASSIESMAAGLVYPIRDIFLLPRDSFWLLTNQEGDRPPPGEEVRSRHVIRVDAGRIARTVDLPKTGWAILGGDEKGVLLLYRDGLIGWLNCQ